MQHSRVWLCYHQNHWQGDPHDRNCTLNRNWVTNQRSDAFSCHSIQSLIDLSPGQLARRPCWSKLTLQTIPPWPVNVLIHFPVKTCHSLIVLSSEPLARSLCWSKLTLQTIAPWPVNVLSRESKQMNKT